MGRIFADRSRRESPMSGPDQEIEEIKRSLTTAQLITRLSGNIVSEPNSNGESFASCLFCEDADPTLTV